MFTNYGGNAKPGRRAITGAFACTSIHQRSFGRTGPVPQPAFGGLAANVVLAIPFASVVTTLVETTWPTGEVSVNVTDAPAIEPAGAEERLSVVLTWNGTFDCALGEAVMFAKLVTAFVAVRTPVAELDANPSCPV